MLFSKQKQSTSKNKRRLSYSSKNAAKTASILFFSVMFLSLLFNVVFFTKYQTIRNSVKASEKNIHDQLKEVENTNLLYSDSIEVFTEDFLKSYLTVPKDEKERQERKGELSEYFVSGFDLKRVSNLKDFKGERRVTDLQYIDTKYLSNREAKVKFQTVYEITEVQEKDGRTIPKTTKYETNIIVPVTSNGKGFAVYQNPNMIKEDLKTTMSYEGKMPDGEPVTSTQTKLLESFLNDFFTSYGVSDEKLPFMADVTGGLEDQTLQDVNVREAVKVDSEYTVNADVHYQNSESSMSDLYSYELKLEKENNKFFITQIE
ncbi:conjugal transfer protein [Metabacillus indicus]|uniref:conjugal transfer protein n=1 Tax=Metabacillus indicus TaxID=246786 RepID=UPI003CF762C3